MKLTAHSSLIEHMTTDEIDQERAVARLKRDKDREVAAWQAKKSVRSRKWKYRRETFRRYLTERADAKDATDAVEDRRWHQRAQRVRKQLTSVDSRIAKHLRAASRWSNAVLEVMIIGIIYTGVIVQRNFFPEGLTSANGVLYWLSLSLEALASLGLMAWMKHHTRAALAGITGEEKQERRDWLVKGGLFLGSLLAAAGPSITQVDLGGMVRTGFAPVMVAVVLLIHDRITRGDAAILARLHGEAEREALRELVAVVEFALQQGLLAPSQDNRPGEVAPSASKIAAYFRINKADAGAVRDEVNTRAAGTTT